LTVARSSRGNQSKNFSESHAIPSASAHHQSNRWFQEYLMSETIRRYSPSSVRAAGSLHWVFATQTRDCGKNTKRGWRGCRAEMWVLCNGTAQAATCSQLVIQDDELRAYDLALLTDSASKPSTPHHLVRKALAGCFRTF